MENNELVKMFNPTLKRRETILFFLIVVVNRLIFIDLDIRLDKCAREVKGGGVLSVAREISKLRPKPFRFG